MAVTQYIGSRYVPLFADPIEWSNQNTYEPLTIVLYQGNSFTSKQAVPRGVDITNEDFWAETGNYNAQIELYRRETADAKDTADNAQDAADSAQQAAEDAQTSANNAQQSADDARTSADNAQSDIDTLLPKADFSAGNTVKDYIDNRTNESIFLAIAPVNNELQPDNNTPTLCISKDGIAFTPIRELPRNRYYSVDAKVSYISDVDKFIIVATNSDENIPQDFLWTVTEDFETFDNYNVTFGLRAFRDTRYPDASTGPYAARRWVPIVSMDRNGSYFASVSMAKTSSAVSDVYNSGFSRSNMGIFIVPISIDANGYPTQNGNPSEISILRLNDSVVNSAFDHSIVFDASLNKYVMSYKDGEYNFVSVATSSAIQGPYTNIAENIFHMVGAEASWITKTDNGYHIYAQNDGNYLAGLTNYLITSNNFTKYGANPYPRLTIDDKLWIRNLAPIFVSKDILKKHIYNFSCDGIQTGSNKKPLLAQRSNRINNIYNGSIARFSVIDGMKIQALPNGDPITIDYFWPVTSFNVTLRVKATADQATVPTLINQAINVYRDETIVSNGTLHYLDFATIPYLVTINNGNVGTNEPMYVTCMLGNKVAKSFTASTLSETSSCVLHTTDMNNILVLININGAVSADAYYDFVNFPTTNSSFVEAYKNDGTEAGLLAVGGRNSHMIVAMTQLLANSHTQAMIML